MFYLIYSTYKNIKINLNTSCYSVDNLLKKKKGGEKVLLSLEFKQRISGKYFLIYIFSIPTVNSFLFRMLVLLYLGVG